MKLKLLAAPLLAVCALTSPLAMAASADLQLNGEIVAGACSISATNNGNYHYGEIPNNSLLSGTRTDLGQLWEDFEVSCAVPTFIGFRLIDNRTGTKPVDMTANSSFGLGLDPKGNPIGYYQVFGPDTNFNGGSGRLLKTNDAGKTWVVMNGGDGNLNTDFLYSFSAGGRLTSSSVTRDVAGQNNYQT